jgi:hypothetical protein
VEAFTVTLWGISFKPAELPGWKRFPQGMTFGLFAPQA